MKNFVFSPALELRSLSFHYRVELVVTEFLFHKNTFLALENYYVSLE